MGAGESDGLVSIQVGITNGSLQTSVAVNFFIYQTQYVEGKPSFQVV